jgi:hypothetical protein
LSTKKKAISLRYADAIGDTEQIHPCYKLRPVLSYLEAAGVPPEAVLYDTGIARAMLDQPYALLSQWQLIALYQNMLRLTPGACALTLGLSCRLSDLGLYGYALHSSTSLHDGCKFALRHWALSLPVTELHLTVSANDACWVIGIQPELQMEMPLRQFVLGYQSGLLLAIQRQLAQAARTDNPAHPTFRLNSVSLACTPPPDTAAYHAQLGCPIEFNARETRLYFDRAWLDRPAPGAHALTFRLLEDACAHAAAAHRAGGRQLPRHRRPGPLPPGGALPG